MDQYRIVYTKAFHRLLRELVKAAKKKVVDQVRSGIGEACTEGEIKSIPRTKHGETRLTNVEKYDLADGHRLVVQLVDGVAKTRAFLFVGTHDEAERWLDGHRNYKWVSRDSDGVLDFVMVTGPAEKIAIPADRFDLVSADSMLERPLLSPLTEDEWSILRLPPEAKAYAASITTEDWAANADGLIDHLTKLASYDKACLLVDLLHSASCQQWAEMHARIALEAKAARVLAEEEAAAAMLKAQGSDNFITFDDSTLESLNLWGADWMLFLPPGQRRFAYTKVFNGPVRLRGVSGSGKTSVLVHRARHLVSTYGKKVLLVTLTRSMEQLLERLVRELFGEHERKLVETATLGELMKDLIRQFRPGELHPLATDEFRQELIRGAAHWIHEHSDFQRSGVANLTEGALVKFVEDEIDYIRSRLRLPERGLYLDPTAFSRVGRRVPLTEGRAQVVP